VIGRALKAGETIEVGLSLGGEAMLGVDYILRAPDMVPPGVEYAMLDTAPRVIFTGGAGASLQAPIVIAPIADSSDEGAGESVSVSVAPSPSVAPGAGAESVAINIVESMDPPDPVVVDPLLVLSESSLSLDEGGSGSYTVALGAAPSGAVTVAIAVSEGAGVSVSPSSLSFTADDWSMAQTVTVTALEDDDIADESGSLSHAASGGGYAGVSASVAVTVADNDDPSVSGAAGAWMPRFGRVVSEQILEGVGDRVASQRSQAAMRSDAAGNEDGGMTFKAMFAGQALGADGSFPAESLGGAAGFGGFAKGGQEVFAVQSDAGIGNASRSFSIPDPAGSSGRAGSLGGAGPSDPFPPADGPDAYEDRSLDSALRNALENSSFNVDGKTKRGSSWGLWGRGSATTLEGRSAAGVAIAGDVLTGQLGADFSAGLWLLGLSASYSQSEGDYAGAGGQGAMESTMAALTPYLSVGTDRFSVWGAAGAGLGDMTLTPERGGAVEADVEMEMGAAGLRGELLSFGNGLSVSLLSDAMAVRSTSEAAAGMPEAETEVSRLRAAVEASWSRRLEGGGQFSARLEGGVRQDDGDAEEGMGGEVSAGLSWMGGGFTFEIEGRHLVTHEDEDFIQTGASAHLAWDSHSTSDLGPSASLRQHWGIATASGLEQLFAMRHMGQFGTESGAGRLDAELGWGLALPGGRFLGTPFLLYGTQGGGSLQTLGWRMEPLESSGGTVDLGLALKLMRRTSIAGGDESGISLEVRLGF